MQRINTLGQTDLFNFASRSAQGKVGAVQEGLSCMLQGRRPCFQEDLAGDHLISQVMVRLPYFLRHKHGGKELHGKEALDIMLKELEKAYEEGTATMENLEPFQVFNFLLEPSGKDKVALITGKVMESVSAKAKVASRACSSTGAEQGQGYSAVAAALDMFK